MVIADNRTGNGNTSQNRKICAHYRCDCKIYAADAIVKFIANRIVLKFCSQMLSNMILELSEKSLRLSLTFQISSNPIFSQKSCHRHQLEFHDVELRNSTLNFFGLILSLILKF